MYFLITVLVQLFQTQLLKVRQFFYSRSSSVTARDESAGYVFRYSKWHRLNQEVEKTRKKNKLDKIPYFSFFDASLRSTAGSLLGVWIENK